MYKEDLIKSSVQFDELAHTYTLPDGTQLSGITGIIHKYIFPDMYKGIPQRTLDSAAERGHQIHTQVQMTVDGFTPANMDLSVADFFNKMIGTLFIASEYLVSDNHHFASAIDIVDSDLNLYDIKTTSTLNVEYLKWQLSIYAYLFELQNPTLKAKGLYGVHLRNGKAKVISIGRIDKAIIADFLCAAADNQPWSNPFEKLDTTLLKSQSAELAELAEVEKAMLKSQSAELAELAEVEKAIAEIETKAKEYEKRRDELKAGLLALMLKNSVKNFETDRLKLSVRAESTRQTFDSKALKEDYPALYEKYLKETIVKPSLTIKIKDNGNTKTNL